MPPYPTLVFSEVFLRSLILERFSRSELDQLFKALRLLDENERHPSLRLHQLKGDLAGIWSASASSSLRITFQRLDDRRKLLVAASRHYGD
jgi:mRNA-degrading endonuclease YafQ of YafQ-DinJ toxin-antitoxin module